MDEPKTKQPAVLGGPCECGDGYAACNMVLAYECTQCGRREAADDSRKASLEDKSAFECSALFGAEAEHERAENLGKTVRWLIGQIDRIYLALCPGQNGVWQERVRQAVEAAEKAPNEKLTRCGEETE